MRTTASQGSSISAILVVAPCDAESQRLDLRTTEAGTNMWPLEPYDDVVFDRTSVRDGVICVSPTQLAVNLLTGPGRDPSEGAAMIGWMGAHEDAWRTR